MEQVEFIIIYNIEYNIFWSDTDNYNIVFPLDGGTPLVDSPHQLQS